MGLTMDAFALSPIMLMMKDLSILISLTGKPFR